MNPERHLITDCCSICSQPVYADQGYYTSDNTHADCRAKAREEYNAAVKKFDSALSDLGYKPKRRAVGQGPTAEKLRARIIGLVQDYYDMHVIESSMWGQHGAYRGPKWDLAAWGANLTLADRTKVSVSSWFTMTNALKQKVLTLQPDDQMPNYFEV